MVRNAMHVSIDVKADLFAAALAMPLTERKAYLRRACGENHELLDHVQCLLDEADAARAFFEQVQWGLEPAATAPQTRGGDTFGPYSLLHEIGAGGCGVVYAAEQAAPVHREVALKIIKLGMDTKAVIARFAAEQQALARMDHPNIAKVLAAGATQSGRPYFVMELVRGIKITQYCDQVRLPIVERLELFTQVCHAIQHAHHKGIVHRDIKPSNVLVTLHDGVAMVKVIDFGIAKALQEKLTDGTVHTALDQFLGTPSYVSPEQFDPRGGDVDCRSDIYSLGVLLYELLTGCTPISLWNCSCNNLDELRSRLRSQEPPKPSRILGAVSIQQQAATAEHRKTTPERLLGLVSGDLEWIVMRCLERDRERRYQSAYELAADLRCFLSHEPISARPPSPVYVLRKFAARHRVLVAATASIMLVLMIATAVSGWLAIRALHAERSAQSEMKVQQQLIGFLRNDLLTPALPQQQPDRDLMLRTVLDRAAERIHGRFTDRPLLEAAIRTTLAETYHSLGELAAAENHFRRALDLYRRELGETDHNTLYVARKYSVTLSDRGFNEQAESLARRFLAIHLQVHGAEHPDTLEAMYDVAVPLFLKGERAAGIAMLVQALDVCRRKLGAQHPHTLKVMNQLGIFYSQTDKPQMAQKLLAQALELRKRMYGVRHLSTITVMNNLAALYADMGRLTEAEPLMAQVVRLRRQVLGAEHLATLISINNLATLYLEQGRLQEAVQLQQQSIEIGRRKYGAEHPFVLLWMNNLGSTYMDENNLDAAYAVLKETVELRRRVLGEDHPSTLVSLANLGLVEHRRGQLAQAEASLRRAWEGISRALDMDSPRRATIGERLADVLLARRKFSDAEPLLRTVSTIRRERSPDEWKTFATLARLGRTLTGLGRYAEAEPLLITAERELRQRVQRIPQNQKKVLKEASDSIQKLYDAWQRPDKRRQ